MQAQAFQRFARRIAPSLRPRLQSTAAAAEPAYDGPYGTLFEQQQPANALVGATGSIQRTFGPHCNADGLLASGGDALAAHASFDPDYHRARDWIHNHSVGPAVVSPVLLSGLTGALTEAAFPRAVVTRQTMEQVQPVVVGVPVTATIAVTQVEEEKNGYRLQLKTSVTRERDDALITEGSHELWVHAV